MKKILLVLFFCLCSWPVISAELIYEGNCKTSLKSIEFPDGDKYSIFENECSWRDSIGDIGLGICYGKIETIFTDKSNLEVICENVNEKNEKFWISFYRESEDLDAGTGTAEYIAGTGRYESLIGTKCLYAARYFKGTNFHMHKCRISDRIMNQLSK